MNEIIVREVDLPATAHGFVMEDPAGDYNIYIRAQDPPALKLRVLAHELQHIELGHLDDDTRTATEKEAEISPKTADLSGLYISPR